MDKLIRTIGNVELRSADSTESRTIQGYAVVFDSESEDIGWIEIIHKGAITQELVDNCDVFAKFNHNDDKILARSNHGKGSLKLTVDDKGVVTSAFALDADGDFVNDNGEAIIDGAFVESELRSAPYFSLRIDGITELN